MWGTGWTSGSLHGNQAPIKLDFLQICDPAEEVDVCTPMKSQTCMHLEQQVPRGNTEHCTHKPLENALT